MATGGDDIDTVGGDDIVADLLSVPFSRRPFNEKMDAQRPDTSSSVNLQKQTMCATFRLATGNGNCYTWLREWN